MPKTTEKQQEQQELTIDQKIKSQIDYLESEIKKTELMYNQLVGALSFAKSMYSDLTKKEEVKE